jgi:prephenate dehydrogenase
MFMQIGIIGLGLMGGSFAKSLKSFGHTIYGYDTNIDTLRYALDHGIIDSGSTFPSDVLPHSHIVIICLYPTDTVTFIKQNMEYFANHTIITDISGIKQIIYDQIVGHLRPDVDFILGHPIAGREKRGIEYSDPTIFKGANYVICPTNKNKPSHIKILEDLIYEMGFSNIVHTTPQTHDSLIAFTSQLTHLIALAIVNANPKDTEISKFIGDSYRDLTRIAMINETLWSELFIQNKDELLKQLDRFITEVNHFKHALQTNDQTELIDLMQQASNIRKKL